MIRARTVLCLALLASTAACGGGGGGGGGAPSGAGGTQASGGAQLPATTFQTPSVVMTSDGTTTIAADQTSQTYTATGAGTDTDPVMLNVNISSGGVTYSNSYDLTHVTAPTESAFQNGPFLQTDPTKNGNNDGSIVVFDDTLSFSQYGIWQSGDGKTIAAFASGTDTPVSDIPQTGTATYAGGAIGRGSTGGNAFTLVGTSNVNVDFDSRQVNGQWNMTAQNGTDTAQLLVTTSQAALAPNSNKISGNIASSSTSTIIPTALSGQMTAALYGPGAAEIGGVGALSGGNTSAVFGFGGKKQ